MEYTKGDWKIDKLHSNRWDIYPEGNPISRVIAEVETGVSHFTEITQEEGQANAYLIAAAPLGYELAEFVSKVSATWIEEGLLEIGEGDYTRMKDTYQIGERQDNICDAREEDIENPILQAKDEILGFLLGEMDSTGESISEPPTSDEEIDKLIEAVKVEYDDIPEFSMFGDPNWKIRDATLEILEWAKGD